MAEQPAKHGRDHLPPGYAAVVEQVSDPTLLLDEGSADQLRSITSSGSVEVLHMYSWNYDTVNTVTTATWTNVCALGGGSDGFFEQAWHSSGYTQSFSFDNGTATLAAYHYHIEGWVQFNENANAGEQRFVALNFGSGNRHIQEYVAVAGSVGNLALHLPVHTPYLQTGGSATVILEVYHDHGSDLTVRGAELVVRRFQSYASGTDEARP